MGSSAGGLHALLEIVPLLPKDLSASVLIVQHLDPCYQSQMSEIVSRRSQIKVVEARDGQTIEQSTAYFAPPNYHMLVEGECIRLTTTELVHFVRPSIDLMFESVAAAYDGRSIGVILTGSGTDGALGTQAIRASGGLTIVQDPKSAESTGMPNSAIATGAVDLILPLEEIGKKLVELVSEG